jgi:hypothetical protein
VSHNLYSCLLGQNIEGITFHTIQVHVFFNAVNCIETRDCFKPCTLFPFSADRSNATAIYTGWSLKHNTTNKKASWFGRKAGGVYSKREMDNADYRIIWLKSFYFLHKSEYLHMDGSARRGLERSITDYLTGIHTDSFLNWTSDKKAVCVSTKFF